MNCPRCKTTLATRELDGITAEVCGSCQGMWLSRKAFRGAAEKADEESGWLAFELWRDAARFKGVAGKLGCPSCEKPMPRLTYGDAKVQLDVCAGCQGAWFDADELGKAVKALHDEVARIPTAHLFAVAFQEAAEIAKEGGSLAAEWKHLWRVARLLELRVLTDHPQLRRLLLSLQ